MINEETQIEKSSRNSWKAQRQRCKATLAHKTQEEKAKSNKEIVRRQEEEKCKEGSLFAK